MAAPLTTLLRKTTKWQWGEAQQKAFEELKEGLLKHNALAYPDLNTPFVLHVDASVEAIGATLSQEDRTGELRLVTCTSRKLNPTERNYPTHEREMLAIVIALKKWKHYLLGAKILAYTDNVALKFWKTAQNPSHFSR